jgi:hypothetical protein
VTSQAKPGHTAPPGAQAPEDEASSTLSSRLSSALRRPVAAATGRLAGLVPGGNASRGPGRAATDEASAYQEAVRQAFLSADSIVPVTGTRRTAVQPGTRSDAGALIPETELEVRPGPAQAETAQIPTPQAIAPDPEPAALPSIGGTPAHLPAGASRRSTGLAMPDELLQVPGSVAAAADDFFGGLVRRAERRP